MIRLTADVKVVGIRECLGEKSCPLLDDVSNLCASQLCHYLTIANILGYMVKVDLLSE